MNMELISLIGGSISGFLFKMAGVLIQAQVDMAKGKIEAQQAADESHDKAAQRGGQWVRRGIVVSVLFAIVVAPFIVAFNPSIGVTIPIEKGFWIFKSIAYETQQGLLIHDSVIQSLYAIIGFYFGSSTLNK